MSASGAQEGSPPRPPDQHREAVVVVRDLVKRFGEVEAVKGVSFSVAGGEAFAFLGPNGAGKSTTISILCTLLSPTSGQAQVAGFDVLKDPLGVRRRVRRAVFAYVHGSAAVKHALSAGVKWGSWTLPVGVELGVIAAIGVVMLALAMQQFGRAE